MIGAASMAEAVQLGPARERVKDGIIHESEVLRRIEV